MFIQELTQAECLAMLAGVRLVRLGCARDNQPYVIPIYLVYGDPHLYGFATPGRKVEWMRANPLVCVELDEVDQRAEWTSILLFGRYEELPDTPEWQAERSRAYRLLQSQERWWEPAAAYGRSGRPMMPVYFRIRIDEATGRRARPNPEDLGSLRPSHAGSGPAWWRRLFRV
jgi:nitroimidazol reductase NimA-like FMN-containing flavoprotein (pyridoxamine 5'-phosphate oxidase superfamily)